MNLQSAREFTVDKDVAANVKQVAIPVNEFSVKGSENEGTVFFDPDAMDYRLVASPKEVDRKWSLRREFNFFGRRLGQG